MDTNVEDKMLHQIEKNLSNHMNENLFTVGQVFEDKKNMDKNLLGEVVATGFSKETAVENPEIIYPLPQLSRAEYIRQAREACLRQLGSMPQGTKSMDNLKEDSDLFHPALQSKKSRLGKLFPEVSEEDTEKEVASFRSLIIRTVCCVVIFLSIFILDKLKVEWGNFSHETVREFITGNDKLVELENILVSWLK